MPIPAEQSSFPTSIDTFTSLSDLPPSLVISAARYQYLKTKETLTSEEAIELSTLTTTLQNYLITPSRWNKFQNCLISMESFISSSWQNYYQYRGIWSATPDPVYEIYNSVKYNDEVYLAIAVPSTNLPTNTTYWVKIGSKGDKGTIWTDNYNSATTYNIDDLSFYGGSTYICIQSGTNKQPDISPLYWSLFAQKGDAGANLVNKGDYSDTTSYIANDLVKYNNKQYYCINPTTGGNLPTNVLYWKVFLEPETNASNINITDSGGKYTSSNVEDALQEVKTIADNNSNEIGILSQLQTVEKTNLVGAVNEIKSNLITYTDVANLTATSINEGTQIQANWTNPTGNDFTVREIYVSTTDISNFTRDYCSINAILLNNTIGTGSGNSDSYTYNSTVGVTYYFKIFAVYNIAGVLKYSNGASCFVIAQDLIPPGDVTSLTAEAGNTQVILSWTNPTNTDFAGVKVLRKTGSYPLDENDGIVIANSNIITITDIGLTNNIIYYYQVFPYDTHGNYNRNVINRISAMPIPYYEYGVSWDKTADTYTRLGDAVGLTAITGGVNDFSSRLPWSEIRRCNMTDSGTINAYYGDPTYVDDGSNGQVMVEIPKFYYKITTTASGYEFWISDTLLTGYTLHPAFYRDRNNDGTAEEINYRYFSAYEGVLHNGTSYVNGNTYSTDQSANVTSNASWKLTSVSGYTPMPYINIGAARTLATRRGVCWGITDFNLVFAVQLLYLVEYAHFDSQAKIGLGYTAAANIGSITTGRTSSLGNVTGNESNLGTDGTHAMSYRGIENFYGNIYKWVDGYITSGTSGSTPITIKIGNVGFNDTGSGYGTTFTSPSNFTNINGYISDLWANQQQLGFTPYGVAGSSTTKLFDNGYLYAGCLPFFGGFWASAASAGCFYFYCYYAASDVNSVLAARLCF